MEPPNRQAWAVVGWVGLVVFAGFDRMATPGGIIPWWAMLLALVLPLVALVDRDHRELVRESIMSSCVWILIAGCVWLMAANVFWMPGLYSFFIWAPIMLLLTLLCLVAFIAARNYKSRIAIAMVVLLGAVLGPLTSWTLSEALIPLRLRLVEDRYRNEAEQLIDEAQPHHDHGWSYRSLGFIDGEPVTVLWEWSSGFLGRGSGVIYDPEGVIDVNKTAEIEFGYHHLARCERLYGEWYWCAMR